MMSPIFEAEVCQTWAPTCQGFLDLPTTVVNLHLSKEDMKMWRHACTNTLVFCHFGVTVAPDNTAVRAIIESVGLGNLIRCTSIRHQSFGYYVH